MDLLEYQGKQLFARHGVPVPEGRHVTDPAEARRAAEELGFPVVVKAHVPPEQQSLLTAPVALSTPTLLGAAMKEPSFAREIAARRRLLEPQGWRARWWATWFHGWRKGATPTPLAESAAPDAPSTA